eukprot:18305-Heterococcus_DN1.PRE.4
MFTYLVAPTATTDDVTARAQQRYRELDAECHSVDFMKAVVCTQGVSSCACGILQPMLVYCCSV